MKKATSMILEPGVGSVVLFLLAAVEDDDLL